MKLVKILGDCRHGGKCCRCGDDKKAENRLAVLLEYDDERPIIEPVVVCRSCADKIGD